MGDYHNAARALFGSEAEKEKNQQLSRSVALLLGQKLLAVGVFHQVRAFAFLSLCDILFSCFYVTGLFSSLSGMSLFCLL